MRQQHLRTFALASVLTLLPAVGLPADPDAAEAVWLTAEDGVAVRGDLYEPAGDVSDAAPVILLFHQAGASRAEYNSIAPRLARLGFVVLALDQRSGGSRWGKNETVAKLGRSTSYLEALPDLEAALKWKAASGNSGKLVVWGSSYSAALVLLLAAEHPEIDGILSFSPGEYLGDRKDEVRQAAGNVKQPVLVLTPEGERERASLVFDAIPGERKELVVPEQAVHGSSMLVSARNPGADEIWPEVLGFLEQFR